MKYKISILILMIFLALPLLSAVTTTDTEFKAKGSNYTIRVDSMTSNKIIIENTRIEFYNVSSSGTNITNLNVTYNATINFINLTASLSVYNVNTSTYLFNSTPTAQNYNATYGANQTLRLVNLSLIDTTAPTITNPRNFTQQANQSFSEDMSATDGSGISYYWLNQTTNFTISQTGVITNVTNLSRVEIYWLNYSVNDTLDNIQSLLFYINITEEIIVIGPEGNITIEGLDKIVRRVIRLIT